MNNKRKNLQDSINKAMNTPIESAEKPYVPEQIDNESVFVPNNEQPQVTSTKKEKTPFEHFSEFYEFQNGQPLNEEQTVFIANIIEQIWEDK